MGIDTSNKNFTFKILHNRGSAYFKIDRFTDAYNDFTNALKLNQNHAKGLFKRAQAHFKLSEFEYCIIDCEASLKIENTKECKKLMEDAKFQLRIVKGKSSYDILGLKNSATSDEIKKAFHKLSLQYHSDKHPDATAVDKKKLEQKFQEIKDAYNHALKMSDL